MDALLPDAYPAASLRDSIGGVRLPMPPASDLMDIIPSNASHTGPGNAQTLPLQPDHLQLLALLTREYQ